eukprot:4130660-Pyramimonas_sp.AAC.1
MDGDWDPFDQLELDTDAFATAGYDGDPESDIVPIATDEAEGQQPAAPLPGAVCPSEALEVKPCAQAPQEHVKAS